MPTKSKKVVPFKKTKKAPESKSAMKQVLILNEWTPKDDNGKSQIDKKTKQPIIIKTFIIKLPVLGRMKEFKVYPKEQTERLLLLDFFAIRATDQLPVKIQKNVFQNDRGEDVEVYDVIAKYDESDDIHVIKLMPHESEKGLWNMAIKEIAANYQPDKAITEYRAMKKAEAIAKNAARLQPDENGEVKVNSEDVEDKDLPF